MLSLFVFLIQRINNVQSHRGPDSDGIHNITGRNPDGSPFAYKLAVRKTQDEWFFLAYDMTQSMRGEMQFNRAIYSSVVVFTLLSLLVGWWSASRVMSPVSELATRLKRSGRTAQAEALASHFPDDEVGQLAAALDDLNASAEGALEPGESLAEAEDEIGVADWIDPETGEPAEGLSPPHLDGD